MPCYSPLKGYRSRSRNSSGNYYFTMKLKDGFVDRPMSVPCGQCIGCRLERSRIWAIRCVHEASLHNENCFITLTFSDEYLDPDGSLRVKHFQLFMKRLRKKYSKKRIRFFHCGEYGEKYQRPHHHACLFGFDFPDKVLWTVRDGVRLYRSDELSSIWGMGHCTIGDVTFESAAYVARYITKKITGNKAFEHYAVRVDMETGELICRQPEFITMSRRPGIASEWIKKYHADIYPDDFVVVRDNVKVKPPKFYDKIYDDCFGDIDPIKKDRVKKAQARKEDNSFERLLVREECKKLRIKNLVRSFEND